MNGYCLFLVVLGTYSQCLEEKSHTELLWQQNGYGGTEIKVSSNCLNKTSYYEYVQLFFNTYFSTEH